MVDTDPKHRTRSLLKEAAIRKEQRETGGVLLSPKIIYIDDCESCKITDHNSEILYLFAEKMLHLTITSK